MLLSANIKEKSLGSKLLFEGLSLIINEGEKAAIIGRNGVGKTTLFHLLTGTDTEFSGEVELKKGIRIIATAQEHFGLEELDALSYILDAVPRYKELSHIIDTYPAQMSEDMDKLHVYSDALTEYGELDFYDLEERILRDLAGFQIGEEQAISRLGDLSGGQKRFIELVRVRYAKADLILLDEPTNHMDYFGKSLFLDWLRKTDQGLLVISHDRDVLKEMTKIIEIKDRKAHVFPGNYDAYLKQNTVSTLTQVSSYEDTLKTLEKLKKQIQAAAARKAGAANSAPKILEERLQREYDALSDQLKKPSFWIDSDSLTEMKEKTTTSYEKYKDRNIHIQHKNIKEYVHTLITVKDLEVGYEKSLFRPVSFTVKRGSRHFLKGRNGAGKSTLLKTIISQVTKRSSESTMFGGTIEIDPKIRLGVYEQELEAKYLLLTLGQAVVASYFSFGESITDEQLNRILATYLFDPMQDKNLLIEHLSGGQKARFQLIHMLANHPNVLILDEPTNHLDLPSIEELERALQAYDGAIIYVSHDSYFLEKMQGDILEIIPL